MFEVHLVSQSSMLVNVFRVRVAELCLVIQEDGLCCMGIVSWQVQGTEAL